MESRYYKDDRFFQYVRFIPKNDMCDYLHRLIIDGHDAIQVCDEIVLLPYFIPIEKLYEMILNIYGSEFGYDYYEAENVDIINDAFTKRATPVRYIIEDTDMYHLSCARYKGGDHVVSFDTLRYHDENDKISTSRWLSHLKLSLLPNKANLTFVRSSIAVYDLSELTKQVFCSDNLNVLILRNKIDNYAIICNNAEYINRHKPYMEVRFEHEDSKNKIVSLLQDMGYYIRNGKNIIYASYIPLYK